MRRLFIVFALGCVCCAGYAQNVLTIGEVFDFEPGDEFHLKNEIPVPVHQGRRITILEKWYNADTVFYVCETDSYYVTPYGPEIPSNYLFEIETDTVFYTHLDSLITTYEGWITGNLQQVTLGLYEEWFEVDSSLCDTEINGSWGGALMNIPSRAAKFGRGLGQTYTYFVDVMEVTENWHMKYYKKGPVTCGKPDLTTAVITELQESSGSVTPNPFTNTLTFQFNDHAFHTICIVDLCGRTLLTTMVTNGQTIYVDQLPQGTFFIQTNTNDLISKICK